MSRVIESTNQEPEKERKIKRLTASNYFQSNEMIESFSVIVSESGTGVKDLIDNSSVGFEPRGYKLLELYRLFMFL